LGSTIYEVSEGITRNFINLKEKRMLKCFECVYMEYSGFDENTYYVRWCGKCNRKCSEVWPEGCPDIKKEILYAEAMEAYNKRHSVGVEEYCAWHADADMEKAAKYAEGFAGPGPKKEDF
jgi:hypothetical protein